jgi:hypothetical protein
MTLKGLLQASQALQAISFVIPGPSVLRIYRKGLIIASHGILEAAQRVKSIPFVIPAPYVYRVKLNGFFIAAESLLESAQAEEANPLVVPLPTIILPRFWRPDHLSSRLFKEYLKSGANLSEASVSLGWILLKAASNVSEKARIQLGDREFAMEPVHLAPEAALLRGGIIRGWGSQKGQLSPSRHLIQDNSEGIDVTSLIASSRIDELLRRHMGWCAKTNPFHSLDR